MSDVHVPLGKALKEIPRLMETVRKQLGIKEGPCGAEFGRVIVRRVSRMLLKSGRIRMNENEILEYLKSDLTAEEFDEALGSIGMDGITRMMEEAEQVAHLMREGHWVEAVTRDLAMMATYLIRLTRFSLDDERFKDMGPTLLPFLTRAVEIGMKEEQDAGVHQDIAKMMVHIKACVAAGRIVEIEA